MREDIDDLQAIDSQEHQQEIIDKETTRFVAYLLELFATEKITKEQMSQCLYQE